MKTIEEVAAEVVAEYSDQYSKDPQFWSGMVHEAIKASVREEVMRAAISIIHESYEPDVDTLMHKALDHWVKSGQLDVGEPSKALVDAFNKAVQDFDGRQVASASTRRLHHIYKSRNAGESFQQIADRLFIHPKTVSELYSKAEQRYRRLKAEVDEFQSYETRQ